MPMHLVLQLPFPEIMERLSNVRLYLSSSHLYLSLRHRSGRSEDKRGSESESSSQFWPCVTNIF